MTTAIETSKIVELLGDEADSLLGYTARGLIKKPCTCRGLISSTVSWSVVTGPPTCCVTSN